MKKLTSSFKDAQSFKKYILNAGTKLKIASFASILTALVCVSIPFSYASDVEIYKVPEDAVGSTTLMFMLDLSGSMGSGSIAVDYGTSSNCTIATDSTTTTYTRDYCTVSANTSNTRVTSPDTGCEKQADNSYRCYDRITRLKDGLRQILEGTSTVPRVSDKIVIGLSTFAGNNGYIRVPARPLSEIVSSYQVAETYIDQEEYQEQVITGYTTQTYNYNQPRWARYTNTESESYRCGFLNLFTCYRNIDVVYYQTCTWNATTQACSWSNATQTIPSGFNASLANYACTAGNKGDCKVFYEVKQGTQQVPVYGTVTKTRPVEKVRYVTKNVTQRDLLLATIKDLKANGGTPTPYAYSEVAAYLMGQPTVNTSTYSGFSLSTADAKNGNSYRAPVSISDQISNADKRECSGQGIYFLTDGQPEPGGTATGWDGKSGTAYTLMSATLGNKASQFDCSVSPLGNRSSYASSTNGWACIGKYTQALLDPAKNPVNLKIKTAVVGFGSSFGGGTTTNDVEDAKSWGTIGEGGWIAGSKPEDVSNSVNKFIGELNKDIPSMSTGSSTIPTDALNPAAVQPYSYFPQFEPKVNPVDTQQIWFGNLKKYYVLNNSVYASQTANDTSVVVKKSKLQDLADIWAKSDATYAENTPIFKKGGALSQLPLGTVSTGGTASTARTLLTDYSYDGTKPTGEQIGRNLNLEQIKYTYTTDAKTKTDTTYASPLMGLLGYNISADTNTNGLDLSNQIATVRQMGSILHSNPILLTQEGKAIASKNSETGKISVGSTNREDYVLFGTTQGLLQVVNATTGVEKFAFVPKEIIERQSETFKNEGGNLAGGKDALYYGMDGEWTAHTVYITKPDGTLTVKGTVRGTGADAENLTGKQWVYGGMRMGGRSYYALDLTAIGSPKLKFHIDPSTSKVYTPTNPSGTTFTALANMGQSWSKPTLGYVNWKGKRKLVMFVGGGYDAGGENGDGLYSNGIRTGYAGYEKYNYKQEDATSTNKNIGAGVYMFDADNGDLLWNADSSTNSYLKYSVAAPIRAIDRNNDGIIDHLYFGDLSGQAFRVDFKNDGNKTAFTAQATRILNLHQTDGTSPRFYTLPTFTAHYSAGKTEGGNIVIATFVSGNKSSPLLATSDSPSATGKKDPSGLQYDAAYAIYDYDVYPSTAEGRYPTSAIAARSLAASNSITADVTKLKYINGATTGATIGKTSGWGGWYYQFNKKFDNTDAATSVIKSLTNPIAIAGSLYVTQYDASSNGTTSSCGAGVKGNSFTQRLCLPTGKCAEDANYKYNLGSGIVTLNIGGNDNDPYKRSIVVPDPDDVCTGANCSPCTGTACTNKPKFLSTGGALKFLPHRWYERYAQSKTP